MRGTALLFKPGEPEPEIFRFASPPTLEFLQEAVGGYIEAVPHFDQIRHGEVIERCIVYCNENGKLDGLPFNAAATEAWDQAIPPSLSLRSPDGGWKDYLVGPVLVLFGDRQFMAEA